MESFGREDMYICDELLEKINKSDITKFLKEKGIKRTDDIRYIEDKKLLLETLVSQEDITEEDVSELFYKKILCGQQRLMRVYKLSEKCCGLLKNKSAWEKLLKRYGINALHYDIMLQQFNYSDETSKLIYIKEIREKLSISRVDMIYVFKILKYNRKLQMLESVNSYLPVTLDLENKELIIKVYNQTGLEETSRPKVQLDAVFDEVEDMLQIELEENKISPENILYDMSRDLFDKFYQQLPNIKMIEQKKSELGKVADILLKGVELNYVSKDKDGLLRMDPGLIDLEDELYKLLQQVALVDYLEKEKIETLLPKNEIYISKIRFSDRDNLEASLTGENGLDCIYDKKTFMGIRNSLDIVKRIVAMRLIFPQERGNLQVKYEVNDRRYMVIHILEGKNYTMDEFKEAWELYKKYERQRTDKNMLGENERFKTTAM